jgi:alkanesulfonate monooxygenase SsuD/methylene tetrahydromethanopterin reductase-like flavin-dependent oxidoreductase (luciferase family)
VRHALFVPPFDGLAAPDRLIELAVVAEGSGWDGFFLWDHLLYPYGEGVRDILDPYVCLGAIATATERVAIGPMVTPLVRRRPAVLARQALTLERMSQGRLVIGLGIGDDVTPGNEFSRFGDDANPVTRGRALDEGLAVLTGLLSGEEVHHDGEFYRARGVEFHPASERAGGIPIWLAARWPNRRPIRRAARFRGIAIIQMPGPESVVELRRQLEGAGADLEHFDIVVLGSPSHTSVAWDSAGVTWLMTPIGPFGIDADKALELVRRGPPP